ISRGQTTGEPRARYRRERVHAIVDFPALERLPPRHGVDVHSSHGTWLARSRVSSSFRGYAMLRFLSLRRAAGALAVSSLGFASPAAALNLFSPQQDVQIGRQAAADVERQVRIVRDPVAESYVNAVVQRLAAAAPGPRFEYRARIVDSPEINAF